MLSDGIVLWHTGHLRSEINNLTSKTVSDLKLITYNSVVQPFDTLAK